MDYVREILDALVDIYEQRRYDQPPDGRQRRAVALDVAKRYPQYLDHLGKEEREIDDAITRLDGWHMLTAPRSVQGYYTKLTLCQDRMSEIYKFLGRKPAQEIRQEQLLLLQEAQQHADGLIRRFADKAIVALQEGRSPGYSLQGDTEKLRDVLLVLDKIEHLQKETYLRNFSEAVFHDSKRFQAISGLIRNVLVDLT